MAQSTTLKEFEAVYPKLEEALLEQAKSYKLPAKELEWYKKVRREEENTSAEDRAQEATKASLTWG